MEMVLATRSLCLIHHYQSTISKAACEAEFKSAFDAANEAVFVLKLLKDIGEPQRHILHFIDNDACVDNIVSKFVMRNTKYMEIKYSWLREKWEDGTIWPVKISSKENISDFLTKAAEDVKNKEQLNRCHFIVNGTYFLIYVEFEKWIKKLCSSKNFTKTVDIKCYEDLLQIKSQNDNSIKVSC